MTTLCDVIDKCEECPRYGDDCDGDKNYISRADAIEAVLTYFIPRSHTGERGEHEEDFVRTIFKALPSADAEWIPCSERLPSVSGTYLTTTAKGSVCTDHYYADSTDIFDRHWSYYRNREPIAWMPLPKPYREDGEDYELATEQMEHDAMYEPTYNSEDGSM